MKMKTKRLIIRPLTLTDFKAWQEAYSNFPKALNEWDSIPKKVDELTLSYYKKVLKSQKANRDLDKFYDFAVFKRDTGEMVGTIALMDVARAVFQNAYLGYRIFNRHWNQGYGKEMVKAILQFAFNDLKLHRVEAGIDPTNRRSIFLARSIGMRKEGMKKRALFLNNKWNDIVIYTLTCEDLKIKFKGDFQKLKSRMR